MDEFLRALGLDLQLLIAGFAGGVVHTFFFKQTDPYTVSGSVISGIFAANYLSPMLSHVSGFSLGACGFVAGFGAMALVQGVMDMIKTKIGMAAAKREEERVEENDKSGRA